MHSSSAVPTRPKSAPWNGRHTLSGATQGQEVLLSLARHRALAAQSLSSSDLYSVKHLPCMRLSTLVLAEAGVVLAEAGGDGEVG